MTKKESYTVPEGYDKDNSDDCKYTKPAVTITASTDKKTATVSATKGTYPLKTFTILIDGVQALSGELTTNPFVFDLKGTEKTIIVVVTDTVGSEASATLSLSGSSSSNQSASQPDQKSDEKKE